MTKKRKFIISGIILVLVISGVMRYRSNSATAVPELTLVQASTVKETTLPVDVRVVGALAASQSVEITPEMPGHVVDVLFQDGALVKQGQVLIQLDDAAYKTKLQTAQARLALSEGKYNRMKMLAKKGFVSQQTIDEVDADLKEKRADAEESSVMLRRMSLIAPFTGRVGKGYVNLGDYVNVGQRVVTLTDTQHLRVEYNVPEKFLSGLKLESEVKVTTTAYPGKTFVGKLAFIAPTITAENRSIALYADIANESNELKPGMFVNITQSLGVASHALLVPARSLVPVLDGQQIYKVVSGKVTATAVTIGTRTGDEVQILEGLAPGDVVITDGQLKVKNGMPVNVKS